MSDEVKDLRATLKQLATVAEALHQGADTEHQLGIYRRHVTMGQSPESSVAIAIGVGKIGRTEWYVGVSPAYHAALLCDASERQFECVAELSTFTPEVLCGLSALIRKKLQELETWAAQLLTTP